MNEEESASIALYFCTSVVRSPTYLYRVIIIFHCHSGVICDSGAVCDFIFEI